MEALYWKPGNCNYPNKNRGQQRAHHPEDIVKTINKIGAKMTVNEDNTYKQNNVRIKEQKARSGHPNKESHPAQNLMTKKKKERKQTEKKKLMTEKMTESSGLRILQDYGKYVL